MVARAISDSRSESGRAPSNAHSCGLPVCDVLVEFIFFSRRFWECNFERGRPRFDRQGRLVLNVAVVRRHRASACVRVAAHCRPFCFPLFRRFICRSAAIDPVGCCIVFDVDSLSARSPWNMRTDLCFNCWLVDLHDVSCCYISITAPFSAYSRRCASINFGRKVSGRTVKNAQHVFCTFYWFLGVVACGSIFGSRKMNSGWRCRIICYAIILSIPSNYTSE